MRRLAYRASRGFTLIEVLVSLLIFSIVTLGILPLIASSIRGATTSRANTVAKNVTVEAMERVRALPYFVSFATQAQRVDVLDFFYPCLVATGCGETGQSYVASGTDAVTEVSGPRFNTVCTSVSTNEACPEVPEDYTVTYQAQFVRETSAVPETYAPLAPPANYQYNAVGPDVPPVRLLSMTITTTWIVGGRAREFQLTSLIADRKFGIQTVLGSGRVAYAVQITTSYRAGDGSVSDLVATLGAGESRTETRLVSTADQTTQTANILLVREAVGTTPAVELANASGATSIYHAPPDQDPAPSNAAAAFTVTHPDLGGGAVAALNSSATSTLATKVASELPLARGTGALGGGAGDGNIEFWLNNQAVTGPGSPLHLQITNERPLVSLRSLGGPLSLTTLAETTGLTSADRKVRTDATTRFGQLRMFPVDFISAGPLGERSVIRINNFTSTVDCKASPSGASVSATYGGTLQIAVQSDWPGNPTSFAGNDDDATVIVNYDLATAGGRAALNSLRPDADANPATPETEVAGTNPMVYEEEDPGPNEIEALGSEDDIYLFPQEHVHFGNLPNDDPDLGVLEIRHSHLGYVNTIAALETPATSNENSGRTINAAVEAAIRISTVPTDPDFSESGLSILVGSLSCEAVDNR